jgi:hypothetical protein
VTFDLLMCAVGQSLQKDAFSRWYCYSCPGGKYADQINGTSCLSCKAGRSSADRSTSCSICPEGTYAAFESPSCLQCVPGQFSPTAESSSCSTCPIAKYQEFNQQTFCRDCPSTSSTLLEGRMQLTDCICLSGQFGSPYDGIPCKNCRNQEGVSCPANISIPLVSQGHWRDQQEVSRILDCIPKQACLAAFADNTTQCAEGYTGYLCGTCVPYQYFRLDSACRKCNSVPALMWILLVLLVVFFLYGAYRISQNSGSIPYEARIGISWMQIISLFTKVSTAWPPEVLVFLRLSSLINFDFELFSPACAVPVNYWSYYFAQMLAPIVFFGFLFLVIAAQSLLKKKSSASAIISRTIYIAVFIVSIMFTFLASKVVGPLDCYMQPDGSFSMYLSPADLCYQGNWLKNYPNVIFFSTLYLGILPLAIIIVFIRNRKKIQSEHFLQRYGALVKPYHPKMFFWEIVATLKKTSFVLLVKALSSASTYSKLLYLIIFLIGFMVLENICMPFNSAGLNGLNTIWNFVAVFLLLSNAMVFEPASTSNSGSILIGILVIVLFLFAVVLSLAKTIGSLYMRKKFGYIKSPAAAGLQQTALTTTAIGMSTTGTLATSQGEADVEVTTQRQSVDIPPPPPPIPDELPPPLPEEDAVQYGLKKIDYLMNAVGSNSAIRFPRF